MDPDSRRRARALDAGARPCLTTMWGCPSCSASVRLSLTTAAWNGTGHDLEPLLRAALPDIDYVAGDLGRLELWRDWASAPSSSPCPRRATPTGCPRRRRTPRGRPRRRASACSCRAWAACSSR